MSDLVMSPKPGAENGSAVPVDGPKDSMEEKGRVT